MAGTTSGNTAAQTNILHAMMLAQAKNEAQQTKMQLQKTQKELEKHKKDADQHKKKADTIEKEHKNTKKELHHLKLQYDGPYAFDYKETKKKAMQRARDAKTKKTQVVREKAKEAKSGTQARKTTSKGR